MGCTIRITSGMCFEDDWGMCRGVYWARSGGGTHSSTICMSTIEESCPGGERQSINVGSTTTFGDGEYTVKLLNVGSDYSTIEVWRTSEVEEEDESELLERAEITQSVIGPGLVFNVDSYIDYSLRIMNTGKTGIIHGLIGLGYYDDGYVWFTGEYDLVEEEVLSGEQFTWNRSFQVLHSDYAARDMTPLGPAVYFMAGHEENEEIIWDRTEYIPVELILENGYVDPEDPDGVPDDWPIPVPGDDAKPGNKPLGLMWIVYIGFASLIGYMLLTSQ